MKNIDKSKLMKTAWEIARTGVKLFGGKVIEYISESMKSAWRKMKRVPVGIDILNKLKSWLDDATWIWLLKYEWAYTDRYASGFAKNPSLHAEAVSFRLSSLERGIRIYLKIKQGFTPTKKQIRWIEGGCK